MSRVIILFLLLVPFAGFSQNFIGKSKARVKKELQEQITKNDTLSITLTDRDSVLVYSVKDPKTFPVDFLYDFDRDGKCQSEKVLAGCEACYNRYLQAALGQKKYEWKKINGNQYVSKYSAQMMIELPAEKTDYSYTIIRTNWTKEMYDIVTGN